MWYFTISIYLKRINNYHCLPFIVFVISFNNFLQQVIEEKKIEKEDEKVEGEQNQEDTNIDNEGILFTTKEKSSCSGWW